MANKEERTIAGGPGERSRSVFYIKIIFAVVAVVSLLVVAWLSVYGRDSEGRSQDTQEFLAQYEDAVIPTSEDLDRGAIFAEASFLANESGPQFCLDALAPLENKTGAELALYYRCAVDAEQDITLIEAEYIEELTAAGDAASYYQAAQIIESANPARAKQLYQQVIDTAPEPVDDEVQFLIDNSTEKVNSL